MHNEDEEVMICCIDNYKYPFSEFISRALSDNLISAEIEDCIKSPRLYVIAGHKDKINQIERIWREAINKAFSKLFEDEQIFKNNLEQAIGHCHMILRKQKIGKNYWLINLQSLWISSFMAWNWTAC